MKQQYERPEDDQYRGHYHQPVVYQPIIYQQLPPPRDYTATAFLILFLYWLGYFPGLIINIIKIMQALETRSQYGRAPGLGCLIITLFVPFLVVGLLFLGLQYLF